MPVTSVVVGSFIHVFTPKTEEFIQKARNLNGKWDFESRCWVFPCEDKPILKQALLDIYGETGFEDDNEVSYVDITLKCIKEDYTFGGPYYMFGRPIAFATGRDSGAKPGEGVVFIENNALSGGSRANWKTVIPEGLVFKIKNVPTGIQGRFDENYFSLVKVEERKSKSLFITAKTIELITEFSKINSVSLKTAIEYYCYFNGIEEVKDFEQAFQKSTGREIE